VWVISGDYKRGDDPTCDPFEVMPCDTFITETTFALPAYRWPAGQAVAEEIFAWWQQNQQQGKASILFCYALGKAQRILAELDGMTEQTVYLHGTMEKLVQCYRDSNVRMLPTAKVTDLEKGSSFAGQLVLAPPSALRTPWMKRFGEQFETGFASGWMIGKGASWARRYDRGFTLSDHADWQELLQTIEETGAKQIFTLGRNDRVLLHHLRINGYDAQSLFSDY
jgi:putative mRNA 3-end processing factor